MKISKLTDMTGGWFVGDFEPSVYTSKDFEVGYKIHPQGQIWDLHYHKLATEINLLVRGQMKICGNLLNAGDIFTIYPREIADPQFITDCEIVTVKVPSLTDDKYVIDRNLAKDYKKFLHQGDIIVQIGASNGVICEEYGLRDLILKEKFNVHLIEPLPDQFALLQQNYINAASTIKFYNLAIWDREGKFDLIRRAEQGIESSFVRHEPTADDLLVNVDVTQLHTFLANNHIDRIDALFLDVEGVEDTIIYDLFANTQLRPKVIRYEYPHLKDNASLTNFIQQQNYVVSQCPYGGGDYTCVRSDQLQ